MIRDRKAQIETLSKSFLLSFFSEWELRKYLILQSKNLEKIFKKFQEVYCRDCVDKKLRTDNYDPPTEIIEQMKIDIEGLR